MDENRQCNRCGNPLSSDAPDGTCPACGARAVPEPETEPTGLSAGEDVTLGFEIVQPGHVLESLARSVGSIPHVLLADTSPDETDAAFTKPSSDEMPTERGARYQLFGEIARGGMGAVLRGRDPDLGRDLAVKVLLENHEGKPELVRRFVEEAQIGGQLQHPGIVPVYELGAFTDRRPYFTMKLVKGRTLASLLGERESPAHDLPRFLSIFEAICQTVAYAHARGVIHRDLKPSNVMVGSFGEVQVMDWGLAKVLKEGTAADASPSRLAPEESLVATVRSGSDVDHSQAGSALGTPAYMAPEQAAGAVHRVDRRADVFGLGSILCDILTGEPAYTGRGAVEILGKAMRGDTADARARLEGCGAEAELIGLAKDCLAVELEDRPRDAGAVAQRITAYLAGVQERVQAAERARAVAVARADEERRRRKVQLALAASVLALTTLGGLSATYYLQQRQARAAAGQRIIDRVATLQRQALDQPEEIPRWVVALTAVEQVDPAGDPNTEARLLALREAIQSGLDAARRDQVLLDRLVDIRSAEAEADDPDGSTTEADYGEAFRAAGIDLTTLSPAEAGARIKVRPPSVALAMAGAMDDWARIRRRRINFVGAARLSETARVADPDPWRIELRNALELRVNADRRAALQSLEKKANFDELPPISLQLLGTDLSTVGDAPLAESALRRAQQRYPRDVWVNYELAKLLQALSRTDEAIRFYTAARAVRPETAHVLAHLLEKRGDREEAIAVFRDLYGLRPGRAKHIGCLGNALRAKGLSREADELFDAALVAGREAIRIKPDSASAHIEYGKALADLGKDDEAAAEWRVAIRLDPIDGLPRTYLAIALNHIALGLAEKGKAADAIATYREAIRVMPDDETAYNNLGLTLAAQGKSAESSAAFREAIRIKPDSAAAHYNLGTDLAIQGNSDKAVAELREAIRLDPDFAEAYSNLGRALKIQGDYAGSLEMFRKGHELGSRRRGWPYPSAQWVAEAERLAALSNRLPAILRGEDKPRDNADRLTYAQAAYDLKHFAAAVRLWSEALASDPKLGDDRRFGHRYNAACAAALAAAGQARDEPPPDDTARAKLRGQALDWLKAELSAWTKLLESGPPQARPAILQNLQHWKQDTDLAGIRDVEALAKLPADETKAWRSLWADVDAILKRAASQR
jgi:eukaryotic-like serine/threonine-protein kinase